MTLVLVVLGAIVGALATGGVSFYAEIRRQRVARKVAARLIHGELSRVEAIASILLRRGAWDRPFDWGIPLRTWHANREAFAARVTAAEWSPVEKAFWLIEIVGRRERPDEPCGEHDIAQLKTLHRYSLIAKDVAFKHAAPKPIEVREWRETLEEIGAD